MNIIGIVPFAAGLYFIYSGMRLIRDHSYAEKRLHSNPTMERTTWIFGKMKTAQTIRRLAPLHIILGMVLAAFGLVLLFDSA